MKRKLLIAATSFMIASSVCGKDFNVLTKDFQPWGNTQFDMEGMKITWTQKWQGGGWWLAQDCSEYESARIEFREVLPMDVVFIVIYSAKDERNEKLKSKVTIPAGKKEAAIMLDITYKKSIDGLGISGSKPGTVCVKSLVLEEIKRCIMKKNLLIAVLLLLTVSSVWAKDYNVETKKFKSWGEAQFDAETATITFTKNWQGGGWWLSRLDCSAYDCIVIEFEEALPMDVMFMATYSAKDDKDQKIKSKVKVPAGKKKAVLELEPAYKNSVDGLGISATKAGVVKLKSLNLKEKK